MAENSNPLPDKSPYLDNEKLSNYPILITRGSFVYPLFIKRLEVGRDFSLNALKISSEEFNNQIILISQKDVDKNHVTINDIFNHGVIASIDINKKISTEKVKSVIFKALERVQVSNIIFDNKKKTWFGTVVVKKPTWSQTTFSEILTKNISQLSRTISRDNLPKGLFRFWKEGDNIVHVEDASRLVDLFIQDLNDLSIKMKELLLEEYNVSRRLKLLIGQISMQQQDNLIDDSINEKIRSKVDTQKREYYLREKLRVIKEELEEFEGPSNNKDLNAYRKRLETEPFPKAIKQRLLDEINHVEELVNGASSEANVIRSYIDLMMALPWWETSQENNDLVKARRILDNNHYSLEKIKDRIIEYLALKTIARNTSGQIICLVGPPGVGKTSLARSIATATDRNFSNITLGGIKDESEIRGHRKTYIGAMPGRIIQSMKKAKTINALVLLDEIDKMSSDYRGDPSSAMLSVLDPDENKHFSDHYVEEEYDLSHVMFIATANYYENIPEALIDRLDIINLSSYTEIEKLHIAQKHLIKKAIFNSGLINKQLKFNVSALKIIIKYYTREAGVRELDRLIKSIIRKFIVKLLKKELTTLTVTPKIVREYLGKYKYTHTEKDKKSQIGVVTGLAYTQYGGDILPIEVNYFPGKSNLILTGKLGEVMRESATIALDYIKANAKFFGISETIFEKNDIHIHVPEGAVPKDGPSAGITLTTAIISALKKQPINNDIGMTGEITLRGHVLPIGGLKEKAISANRSGLKHIVLPLKNERDLDDIPKEVSEKLQFHFVSDYKQIFKLIFKDELLNFKKNHRMISKQNLIINNKVKNDKPKNRPSN